MSRFSAVWLLLKPELGFIIFIVGFYVHYMPDCCLESCINNSRYLLRRKFLFVVKQYIYVTSKCAYGQRGILNQQKLSMTLYSVNDLVRLRYRAVCFSQAQFEHASITYFFTVSPEDNFVIRWNAQKYFLGEKNILIFNRILNNMFRKCKP